MAEDKNALESMDYRENPPENNGRIPGWIKVGAVAAASVLAGGLAATWYYRKTLARLRHAEHAPEDSNSGRIDGRTDDETWHI